MNFDYFSCIQHNVVVDSDNLKDHIECDKVGEYFQIKVPKKKVFSGLIAKKFINDAKEKINIEKSKERKLRDKRKKVLAQERFEKQIPDQSAIVNLLEMKI